MNLRRVAAWVGVAACGGGRPLEPPQPPPTWPLHNLVAPDVEAVPAPAPAAADPASASPAAPLPVSALLPEAPDGVTLRCGETATAIAADTSLVALPPPLTGCTLEVVAGERTYALTLPDGPGPLTCAWEPPACTSTTPPAPGATP